jgi:hypothetical protein
MTRLDLKPLQVGNVFANSETRLLKVAPLVQSYFGAAKDAYRRDVVVEPGRDHSHPLAGAHAEFLSSEVDVLEEASAASAILLVTVTVAILVVTVIAILRRSAPRDAEHSQNEEKTNK